VLVLPFISMRNLLLFAILIHLLVACNNEKDLYRSLLEEGEQYPGGAASTDDFSMNAFGHAAPNLTGGKDMDFVTGNAFFKRNWVTAPSSTEDLDGLGPLFNARSCSSCHEFDGKGAPPTIADEEPVDLLFRLSVPGNSEIDWETLPEPSYGGQFNHLGIVDVPSEGKVKVTYTEEVVTYPDGKTASLRRPNYQFYDLNYGEFSSGTMISPRLASHLIGLGLLEAIPEDDLKKLEDIDDKDQDGISGKINYVWDVESKRNVVGRFGWKANQPSVRQQVAAAFLGDIGITSSIFPSETCTAPQKDCEDAFKDNEPELKESILNRVTLYSQTLAVPMRRSFSSDSILEGKQLFNQIGCNSCHNPSFTTGAHPNLPEFENQKIFPYTDLLVHDMGEGLADNRPDGLANGKEWRTAPLWGIGLSETVNGHTFLLHDGRARNVEEAILWHGGEAEKAKNQFSQLTATDRKNVIDFVNSL
jgi:CxxC motif-containing protein (DUF1111 family)